MSFLRLIPSFGVSLTLMLVCFSLQDGFAQESQPSTAAHHTAPASKDEEERSITPQPTARGHTRLRHTSVTPVHAVPRGRREHCRSRKLQRAFVASSQLRPMAQQLAQDRTPAAYAGVTHYAQSTLAMPPPPLMSRSATLTCSTAAFPTRSPL